MRSSQSCEVTYQRVVEFNEKDPAKDRTPRSSPRHDVTDEELKYCFHQIILTASVSEGLNNRVYSERHTCIMPNHSSTSWKKDSLHTQILRSERAGIDAVVLVMLDALDELDERGWRWECRQCHASNSVVIDAGCSNCRNVWRDSGANVGDDTSQ